jgi:hypothetical protein
LSRMVKEAAAQLGSVVGCPLPPGGSRIHRLLEACAKTCSMGRSHAASEPTTWGQQRGRREAEDIALPWRGSEADCTTKVWAERALVRLASSWRKWAAVPPPP